MSFIEKLDVSKSKYILNCPNDFILSELYDPEERNQEGIKWDSEKYIDNVKKFLKRVILNKGELNQSYKYSNRLRTCGRRYIKGFGIQSLQHKLRGFLCSDYYDDFDIKNAHPTLLNYLIKKHYPKKEFQNLSNYIKNRDKIINKYKFSKKDILISMNSDKILKTDNLFLRAIDQEFKEIQNLFYFSNHYENYKDDNKKNKKGSFLNVVLTILENEILEKVIKEIDGVGVLMFDGFLKEKGAHVPEVINKLNELTQEYGIEWVNKPHNLEIEIDEGISCNSEIILDYSTSKINFEEKYFEIKEPLLFGSEDYKDGELISYFLYNKNDFSTLTLDEEFQEVGQRGEIINKNTFSKWLRDKTRRQYKKIDFIPSDEYSPDIYNSFKGFNYKPVKGEICSGVLRFLEHLKLLVNYEEESFIYLVQYIADIFQNPARLPEIAILIKSQQGVGKDLLIDFLGKLLGEEYFYRTEKLSEIFEKFNGSLKNKLILQLNEIQGSDGFAKKENLKNLITAKKININEKNLKPYTLTNYLRIFIFSNNLSPIEIPHDDRRYIVFESGFKKNKEYYNQLYKDYKNEEIMNNIFYYFKNYDLSNFDISQRPITKAYLDMKQNNIHPIYQYLYNIFNFDRLNEEEIKEQLEAHLGEENEDYFMHKKSGSYCITPANFRQGFAYYLKNEDQEYIKNNSRIIKKRLEELGIIRKRTMFGKRKISQDYYYFKPEKFLKKLEELGVEIIEWDEDYFE